MHLKLKKKKMEFYYYLFDHRDFAFRSILVRPQIVKQQIELKNNLHGV